MCGILGIFSPDASALPSDSAVARMRDRMRHRGPDGAGLWRSAASSDSRPAADGVGVILGHRRLAVLDTTDAAHQPMLWNSGSGVVLDPPEFTRATHALIYNGELYNDAELRDALARRGVSFRTRSDTETVLAALSVWGFDAVDRLRGMYALAFYDAGARSLLLARDPLGIKPLYAASVGVGAVRESLVFASEIGAILDHPEIPARPDWQVVSAYMTTIRTTLGPRTMYDGVRTLEPGERLIIRADHGRLAASRRSWWDRRRDWEAADPESAGNIVGPFIDIADEGDAASADDASGTTRRVIQDSIIRHLRSDVPLCCLLSGGLDSSIVAAVSSRAVRARLSTFCAGAADTDGGSDDFAYARLMSDRLGSSHHEAPVDREMFLDRWRWMVCATGVPMSTPNEVAINQVARELRSRGNVVALSGEGADELFGGYDGVMSACAGHARECADRGADWRSLGGAFHLDLNSWTPIPTKGAVFNERVLREIEGDALLTREYDRLFAEAAVGVGDDGAGALEAHLRFQRRVNLAGLLLRLDQATMLESVEGRTPLADQSVAIHAESLPMRAKFSPAHSGAEASKIALRRAFTGLLPRAIVDRPKASFPLPFQGWMSGAMETLRGSRFANEAFTSAAIQTVAAQPTDLWRLAWPMANLAIWGERFE